MLIIIAILLGLILLAILGGEEAIAGIIKIALIGGAFVAFCFVLLVLGSAMQGWSNAAKKEPKVNLTEQVVAHTECPVGQINIVDWNGGPRKCMDTKTKKMVSLSDAFGSVAKN